MKKIVSIILAIVMLFSIFAVASIQTLATEMESNSNLEPDSNLETYSLLDGIPGFTLTAAKFTSQIKAGWNLGNTFDSTTVWGNWPDDLSQVTPETAETAWNNPKTTQKMIDAVAAAGYDMIRIPVTWELFVDDANGYKVDNAWMTRVKEVVDYAYNNNMYIILNMHHDDQHWLDISAQGKDFEEVKTKYAAIWTQIATTFKDYNEKLILEGLNEPLDRKNSSGSADWYGHEDYYFDNLTVLYKLFVDTVRATGGNNEYRYLMIPTYGAQCLEHQISKVVIPNNDKRIIVDLHYYKEVTYDDFSWWMRLADKYFIKNGYGVIIGETGIVSRRTTAQKIAWAETYYSYSERYGLPVCIWDDGGDYEMLDRRTRTWETPGLNETIIAIVNGEHEFPTVTTPPTTTALKTPEDSGDFIASSMVYYKWNKLQYSKTEGWQSGASNFSDATCTVENDSVNWKLSNFKSQQINSNWTISALGAKSEASKVLNYAKNAYGYLIFDVTLNSIKDNEGKDATGVYIKHSLMGVNTEERSIFVNNGTTRSILVDVSSVSVAPQNFTFYIQQFDEGMTEIDITISKVTMAIKPGDDVNDFTTTTTTIAPTTTKSTSKTVYGDANEDDKINMADVLILRKYLAKWNVVINAENADCNADTKINMADVLLLRKYLAKWDVKLGK